MKKTLTFSLALICGFAIFASESKNVGPITESKYYSAENSPANEIDKLIKREIRPEEFDIWHDRKDRVYLNGSWKFIKLANTLEIPECDYGIKHGFEKPGFDDSKWFNQPVPYNWHFKWKPFSYQSNADRKGAFHINNSKDAGIGWYRKTFTLPEKDKGKRIILHFQAVEQKSTVYVNGVKVAANETLNREHGAGHWGLTYTGFEVDVTDLIRFNEKNFLAVRVYDDGQNFDFIKGHKKGHYPGIAGIWQEVYLEIRPEIYLKEAMVTPRFKDSSIDVKAVIINTLKEAKSLDLKLWLGPWKSKRYKLADWKPNTIDLGEHLLKPGDNEIDFSVKIDDVHAWSPESPLLYHMKLLDSNGDMLGQERFGFRELTAGSQYFHLNGKKVLMRGDEVYITGWGLAPGIFNLDIQMGLLNRRNTLEKFLDMYKDLNLNAMRTHSNLHPHAFHELCDEKGLLICVGDLFSWSEPFFDGDGKITPAHRAKIKKVAREIYKYPSVALYSMGNELYDTKLIGTKHKSWQPALDQIYDEFKKHIKHVPMGAAGRPPTRKASEKVKHTGLPPSEAHAKTDFYTIHNYMQGFYGLPQAEEDECGYSMKRFRKVFMEDGGPKVMYVTEGNCSSLHPKHRRWAELEKMFESNIKNGKIDKQFLVDEWQYVNRFNFVTIRLYCAVFKFGFLNSIYPAERRMKSEAEWTKRLHELVRRKRDNCAGLASNGSMNFERPKYDKDLNLYYNQPVADAMKKANQPVLACVDAKWNRNLFSGENGKDLIYIMNDHENPVTDVQTDISLVSEKDHKRKFALGSIKNDGIGAGDMLEKDFDFTLPSDIPTGHYRMNLSVSYKEGRTDRVLKSENDYNCFVMNRQDVKLQEKPTRKVALLLANGDVMTEKTLANLDIQFDKVKDFKKLADYSVLIFGPYSYRGTEDENALMDWLKKGGSLLSFAQEKLPKKFGHELKSSSRFGYFSELIEWDHPIFKGLRQDDFRLWNAKRGKVSDKWLFKYGMTPLDLGMLSTQEIYSKRMSMTSAAYRVGEGKMILSQFESVKRFAYDSVATKLTLNIMDWCFKDFPGLSESLPLRNKAKTTAFNVPENKVDFIDISKQCDMAFADETAHDGKGGWTDQGPDFDLRNIPLGKQIFNGVPFKIIDPKDNNGKSCIVLRGPDRSKTAFLPEKVKINLGARYKKLYFLVSSAWAPRGEKDIGKLRVVAEGRGIESLTVFDVKLRNKFNIADWWDASSNKPPFSELGWCGPTKTKTKEVGTYIIEWANPLYKSDLKLLYIEFDSDKVGVPILLAITGEK